MINFVWAFLSEVLYLLCLVIGRILILENYSANNICEITVCFPSRPPSP